MNKIEFGDCRETMRRWKEQGIKAQTCVTSPPYYGLRDYGHEGQLGLEETPEQYIKAMVEVFRCVWDVLEDDGTLWLNIGDSYANNTSAGDKTFGNQEFNKNRPSRVATKTASKSVPKNCKPKDLIGIPWMMAFALRADGWYLRQDIIWHKPNPMPESVTDRCTKAHEYIFLMSKSQKYYYNIEPIREPIKPSTDGQASVRRSGDSKTRSKEHWGVPHNPENVIVQYDEIKGANKRSVWTVATKPYAGAPVGGIVLDPFMGSGTTAEVAQNLGRQYIGCELNPDYFQLQNIRTAQQSLDFV